MRTIVLAAMLAAVGGCASTHRITPQLAAESVDFAQAPSLEVRLSSYEFTPSTIRMNAGRPYALKLVNGPKEHTFTAPEFFAAAKVAPRDAAQIADGEVKLSGGQSVTVHLVPTAGQYKVVCTEFGHAMLGMRGTIVVE